MNFFLREFIQSFPCGSLMRTEGQEKNSTIVSTCSDAIHPFSASPSSARSPNVAKYSLHRNPFTRGHHPSPSLGLFGSIAPLFQLRQQPELHAALREQIECFKFLFLLLSLRFLGFNLLFSPVTFPQNYRYNPKSSFTCHDSQIA